MRSTISKLIVTTAALLLLFASSSAAGTIKGKVVDETTKAALADADVTL
jgi:hypothetical protein